MQRKHPTYVEDVVPSTLPVHSIHKVAGSRFQEEAEDGHAHTETLHIAGITTQRVVDRDVNDVCEDREQQAGQELGRENRTWTGWGIN